MITIRCDSPAEAEAVRTVLEDGTTIRALPHMIRVELRGQPVGGASDPGYLPVLDGITLASGDRLALSTREGDGIPSRTTWWQLPGGRGRRRA